MQRGRELLSYANDTPKEVLTRVQASLSGGLPKPKVTSSSLVGGANARGVHGGQSATSSRKFVHGTSDEHAIWKSNTQASEAAVAALTQSTQA